MERISKHYDDTYSSWEEPVGEFGGWASVGKFSSYIRENDDVLDFGCGCGYLLSNVKCRTRVGVEVSPFAAKKAREMGIEIYRSVAEVPNEYVDVIISDNALEHTLHPLLELQELFLKLRKGGKIVFVVPCESISMGYRPKDINHHLFSWSPMCLGNLFTEAGFTVIESRPYIHKWPPKYQLIARFGGKTVFHILCRIYGRIARSWFQVRVVAGK